MSRLTEEMVIARTRANDLGNIRKLNVWGSGLSDVSLLRKMHNVEILSLSVNKIGSLQDFQWCHNLQELYVRRNEIKDLNEVCYLRDLPRLRSLWLDENPCAACDLYRMTVLRALPHLQKLDNVAVTPEEIQEALRRGLELFHPDEPKSTPTLQPHEGYSVRRDASSNSLYEEYEEPPPPSRLSQHSQHLQRDPDSDPEALHGNGAPSHPQRRATLHYEDDDTAPQYYQDQRNANCHENDNAPYARTVNSQYHNNTYDRAPLAPAGQSLSPGDDLSSSLASSLHSPLPSKDTTPGSVEDFPTRRGGGSCSSDGSNGSGNGNGRGPPSHHHMTSVASGGSVASTRAGGGASTRGGDDGRGTRGHATRPFAPAPWAQMDDEPVAPRQRYGPRRRVDDNRDLLSWPEPGVDTPKIDRRDKTSTAILRGPSHSPPPVPPRLSAPPVAPATPPSHHQQQSAGMAKEAEEGGGGETSTLRPPGVDDTPEPRWSKPDPQMCEEEQLLPPLQEPPSPSRSSVARRRCIYESSALDAPHPPVMHSPRPGPTSHSLLPLETRQALLETCSQLLREAHSQEIAAVEEAPTREAVREPPMQPPMETRVKPRTKSPMKHPTEPWRESPRCRPPAKQAPTSPPVDDLELIERELPRRQPHAPFSAALSASASSPSAPSTSAPSTSAPSPSAPNLSPVATPPPAAPVSVNDGNVEEVADAATFRPPPFPSATSPRCPDGPDGPHPSLDYFSCSSGADGESREGAGVLALAGRPHSRQLQEELRGMMQRQLQQMSHLEGQMREHLVRQSGFYGWGGGWGNWGGGGWGGRGWGLGHGGHDFVSADGGSPPTRDTVDDDRLDERAVYARPPAPGQLELQPAAQRCPPGVLPSLPPGAQPGVAAAGIPTSSRRPVARVWNSNVLSAVLCLIKELDFPSLEVVEVAVRTRMDEF